MEGCFQQGQGIYVGVDGGQSGTRCLIIDGEGNTVGTGQAGPVDFILAPGGRERFRKVLQAAFRAALPGSSCNRPVRAAFLGISGVVPGGQLEQTVRDIAVEVLAAANVFVHNDGYAAWAGALRCQPGIIAIAGTGSIILAVDARGNVQRAGGWGYLFGDEAGAFGIARAAIKAALQAIDKGEPNGVLSKVIELHFGLSAPEVVKAFYAGKVDRRQIAALTARLASAGSSSAAVRRIFADAGQVLADQIIAVARRAVWENEVIPWSPVGGVFKSGDLIMAPMLARLKKSSLSFTRIEPRCSPEKGAAILAYRKMHGRCLPA